MSRRPKRDTKRKIYDDFATYNEAERNTGEDSCASASGDEKHSVSATIRKCLTKSKRIVNALHSSADIDSLCLSLSNGLRDCRALEVRNNCQADALRILMSPYDITLLYTKDGVKETLNTHRDLLQHHSLYFAEPGSLPPPDATLTVDTLLELCSVRDAMALQHCVSFMYNGVVECTAANVCDILRLVHGLHLVKLEAAFPRAVFGAHLLDFRNVFHIFVFAQARAQEDVAWRRVLEEAVMFVRAHFEVAAELPSLGVLDCAALMRCIEAFDVLHDAPLSDTDFDFSGLSPTKRKRIKERLDEDRIALNRGSVGKRLWARLVCARALSVWSRRRGYGASFADLLAYLTAWEMKAASDASQLGVAAWRQSDELAALRRLVAWLRENVEALERENTRFLSNSAVPLGTERTTSTAISSPAANASTLLSPMRRLSGSKRIRADVVQAETVVVPVAEAATSTSTSAVGEGIGAPQLKRYRVEQRTAPSDGAAAAPTLLAVDKSMANEDGDASVDEETTSCDSDHDDDTTANDDDVYAGDDDDDEFDENALGEALAGHVVNFLRTQAQRGGGDDDDDHSNDDECNEKPGARESAKEERERTEAEMRVFMQGVLRYLTQELIESAVKGGVLAGDGSAPAAEIARRIDLRALHEGLGRDEEMQALVSKILAEAVAHAEEAAAEMRASMDAETSASRPSLPPPKEDFSFKK